MYRIETDSPLFAVSVPHKTFRSFVRAVCNMRYAVLNRARDYGYGLYETIAYEMNEGDFVVEFIDDFDLVHTFHVVKMGE